MTPEDFMALCEQAQKDGPIASWITTDIRNHNLWRQYLAMKGPDQSDEWQVYSFREEEGVMDLGKFQGRTPMEVYKIVPRKVLV